MTGACGGDTCLFDAELVTLPFNAIANGLILFSGPKIFNDSHIAERRKHVVIEVGRTFYVGNREGDVMKHVHGLGAGFVR